MTAARDIPLPRDAAELLPALQRLREARAFRFDPVRFRFIEAMAQRSAGQRAAVSRLLGEKSRRVLADYLNDYRAARELARATKEELARDHPDAADEIDRLFDAGDFKAIQKRAAQWRRPREAGHGPLAALTREVRQRRMPAGPESFDDELRRREREMMHSLAGPALEGEDGSSRSDSNDLGVLRYFREARTRQGTERLLDRIIGERPENPGPLNSQALIIRTISHMRALSPGYANRFVDYLDTLLWLEQAGTAATREETKKTGRRKGTRKGDTE